VICEDVARDLDAYIDRELPSEREAAIREHLRTCAACQRRAAEREALGRLVRGSAYDAPARLRARVSAQARTTHARQRLVAWAAAAALVVATGGAIALVRAGRTPVSSVADGTADEVVASHVRSLMADHLFDVESTDQHTVKPWFLGKIDFSPPVTDLASIGFPLVGGRLDYISGRPVAALVYRRNKHTINLFVSPARDETAAMSTRSVRGFHVRHWIYDGMSFWAVSDLNDAELTEFARALHAS
jgi:mycothiol system anti-sigma-R factor